VFASQDGGDVYVMTIYRAIVLQCRIAVMYTSLLNERYELETVVAGESVPDLQTYRAVVSATHTLLHSTCWLCEKSVPLANRCL